jgi:hypothetical protein
MNTDEMMWHYFTGECQADNLWPPEPVETAADVLAYCASEKRAGAVKRFQAPRLPFPPDLVKLITDGQIADLAKVFSLDAPAYQLCNQFQWMNVVYAKSERYQDGAALAQRIRDEFIIDDWPEAFFLLALSYRVQCDRPQALQLPKKGLFFELDQRTQDNVRHFRKAIAKLIELIDLGADAKGSLLYMPLTQHWARYARYLDMTAADLSRAPVHRGVPPALGQPPAPDQPRSFRELLDELLERVNADSMQGKSFFDRTKASATVNYPDGKLTTVPRCIQEACMQVASLHAKAAGQAKYGDAHEASQLFSLLGIKIDPVNVRQTRRRTKEGSQEA